MGKQAPVRVALTYPSPYAAGMSSLGFQRIYRALQEAPGLSCERCFLDDDARPGAPSEVPITYESGTELAAFRIIALSVAYELELGGIVQLFDAAGIPALREDRDDRHPFVLAGGPLTFSNPLPLGAFVDAIVMGEAEGIVADIVRAIDAAGSRAAALDALAAMPHVYVPARHLGTLPTSAQCDDALLPAWAPIRTPHAELRDMFLVEVERGCSRGCTYCVMRRSTNGGMRIVPAERVLSLVPEDARRVGLVGAAVSDHPKIVEIVSSLADRGCDVGLSSLRPDRLTEPFVAALARAGHRTLTTAMDGTSERVREGLERRAKVQHLTRAAELARAHGMDRLKLYLMIGVPGEEDADVDECVELVSQLSRRIPVALGIAPFCSKRNTPLDGQPYAGIDVIDRRLERLRRGLRGRADVRGTSARWGFIEWVLAQGGEAEGRAALTAVRAGGSFAAYKKAFAALPTERPRRALAIAPA